MKKNVGNLDSYLRTAIAAGFTLAVLGHRVEGLWAAAALVVAVLMAVTGYVRFCPIYPLFGIRTTGGREG